MIEDVVDVVFDMWFDRPVATLLPLINQSANVTSTLVSKLIGHANAEGQSELKDLPVAQRLSPGEKPQQLDPRVAELERLFEEVPDPDSDEEEGCPLRHSNALALLI